jgi:anti-sigma factor RsiW
MQHLDEGTIHSWLDGALSADEAARVQAHVQECPQCAAAVAEARGFIAASSRILTSLDNVPRAVMPVGPQAKARNWAVWRAAAAVLVVALGSFVVLRDRVGFTETSPRLASTVASDSATPTGSGAANVPMAQTTADAAARKAAPIREPELQRKSAAAPAPKAVGVEGYPEALQGAVHPPVVAQPLQKTTAVALGRYRQDIRDNAVSSAAGATVGAAAPSPQTFSLSGKVAMNAELPPPRVVGAPHVLGEKHTLYEVALGDTVLWAEVTKSEVGTVTTGVATEAATTETSPSVKSGMRPKTSTAADNARRVESAGITTLSWIDSRTGSSMRLSGRHTEAELIEIRRRIEQARAAEAAKKKP